MHTHLCSFKSYSNSDNFVVKVLCSARIAWNPLRISSGLKVFAFGSGFLELLAILTE